MKYITIVFVMVVCLFGLIGGATADIREPSIHVGSMQGALLSAQDHLSHAQNLEQKIDRLAKKVIEADQKVAKYNEKPYLDTKGIRRTGLKLLMGSTLTEIKELREQVAWHRAEASRLAKLETTPEELDSKVKPRSDLLRETVRSKLSTHEQS